MAIGPGSRIGPYEVTALLGEGGMGKVWRAHHSGLKRDDALKVLPDAFVSDSERLARFQREAQVLASLNHPNIAHVHGLERSDGVQALVMELVEGPTLADRIAQGPIPVDEALPIAKQIAEALEAAHEQGIIHRDLKPANIKVRPDGTVKVLDFGLAKALDPTNAASPNMSQSPTITSPAMMTGVGVLLGTAAYMSPEQAKGRPVDKRSDLWAFGCVLYEMLTGRRAFEGEDVSDTLANALKAQPDWSLLPSDVPPSIEALLKQCLEKDRRYRIGDVAAALFALRSPVATWRTDPLAGPSRWRRISPVVLAGILSGAVAAGVAWAVKGSTALPVTRLQLLLPEGEQFSSAAASRKLIAISRDATRIAYVTSSGLWVRRLIDSEGRRLVSAEEHPAGIQNPVFSPDGQSVAFYSVNEGALKRVAVTGGAVATIAASAAPNGLGWTEEGIVFGTVRAVMRVLPDAGSTETLVSVGASEAVVQPVLLPGGRSVLFTVADQSSALDFDRSRIVVQSLETGERTVLIDGGSDAMYLRTGHLVYSLGGVLWAVPFDVTRLEVTGAPVSVVEGVGRGFGGVGLATAQYSVADNGVLIYVPGPEVVASARRTLVAISPTGTRQPLNLPAGAFLSPRVSPDGRMLAVVTDDAKGVSIWIHELNGGASMRRLTLEGKNRYPMWSPDSRRLVFQSDREGDFGIWWQAADGSGPAERLTRAEKGSAHVPESWIPNDTAFAFSLLPASGEVTLWTFSVSERRADLVKGVRSPAPLDATFSPDGRWMAYTARGPGRANIQIEPLPPSGAKFEVPGTGHHPLWSRDGSHIVYFPGAQQLTRVPVAAQSGLAVGNSEPVLGGFTSNTSSLSGRNHDFTPDGHIVAVLTAAELSGPTPAVRHIEVVQNWHEELKRLVPTN